MRPFLFHLKNTVKKETTALLFLSKLLILLCILKCAFFAYNYRVAGGWSINNANGLWRILEWSLLYDASCLVLIFLPFLLISAAAGKFLQNRFAGSAIAILFTLPLTLVIFLNTVDIFYYRFHLQRADADLLYVMRNPFVNGTISVYLLLVVAVVFCALVARLIYRQLYSIAVNAVYQNRHLFTISLFLVFSGLFLLTGTKKILPTYPLTDIEAVQLPLAQNSFHSFVYSIYRRDEAIIPRLQYLSPTEQQYLLPIRKKNHIGSGQQKNIVLFIMESVPADFFDSSSPYKVNMPFLDSLVNRSTWFSNAFSYAYTSNKGITAILAGLPTITDIPLYHSNYTSIERTAVGSALAKKNYQSAFFIGDNYDDFGFAKCCKWLGIQHYYCMEDIPGYQQMEKHSLGLQDEYVLNFMQQKIASMQEPFFTVQYNISTHYPNDIPAAFKSKPQAGQLTKPMRSMQYYNDCLAKFFKEASRQPWYHNTVFLFCSDHWAQPGNDNIGIDNVKSFRVPLFMYEPSNERKLQVAAPVSQFDILNTVLHFGGYEDSITSYGNDLTDTLPNPNRIIFTRTNSAVYQAISNDYVLGFDAMEGKALYCYAYKTDTAQKNNLLKNGNHLPAVDSLLLGLKGFLQTASNHYRNVKSGNR